MKKRKQISNQLWRDIGAVLIKQQYYYMQEHSVRTSILFKIWHPLADLIWDKVAASLIAGLSSEET